MGISFSELLAKTLESLAKGKSVNRHIGPQIESDDELNFICSLGTAARFVDLRHLTESLVEITELLGLEGRYSIPHYNQSATGEGWVWDRSTGNERVRSRDFARQSRLPTLESLFTDSMSAQFRAAFDRDFVLSGFCSALRKRVG